MEVKEGKEGQEDNYQEMKETASDSYFQVFLLFNYEA